MQFILYKTKIFFAVHNQGLKHWKHSLHLISTMAMFYDKRSQCSFLSICGCVCVTYNQHTSVIWEENNEGWHGEALLDGFDPLFFLLWCGCRYSVNHVIPLHHLPISLRLACLNYLPLMTGVVELKAILKGWSMKRSLLLLHFLMTNLGFFLKTDYRI